MIPYISSLSDDMSLQKVLIHVLALSQGGSLQLASTKNKDFYSKGDNKIWDQDLMKLTEPLYEKKKPKKTPKKQQFGFLTRSDTNRPVESQKQASSLNVSDLRR